jgi:ABC-type multidrug transport system ATPase subunit
VLRVERLQIAGLPPLSFEVPAGECLAVEGASGAGKTLLLRAIADLDAAPGDVTLDGEERREMTPQEWRRGVRYCAAEPVWWCDTPRGCLAPVHPRIDRLMQSLDLEESLLDRPVATLSTGERQRLALVRALLDEPKVLLLDEPTGALDPQSTALTEELIRFQLLSGHSVLLVSHDQTQVERPSHARLLLSKANGGGDGEGARRS